MFKKTVLKLDSAFKRDGFTIEMVLLLHDGTWFTCPQDFRGKAEALIRQVMENSVALSVPLMVTFD